MTRVLIIDDDGDFARALVTIIGREAGWSVEYATTIALAEQLLKAHRFDAVILDRNLAGNMSDDFWKDLRDRPTLSDVAVVMVTGYGTPQHAAEMVRLGVFQYMTKPLPLETVVPTMRAAIGWQRARALCRDTPLRNLTADAVYSAIRGIVESIHEDGDHLPRLYSSSDSNTRVMLSRLGGKRSALLLDQSQIADYKLDDSAAATALVARVAGHTDGNDGVMVIGSNRQRAFEPVWQSVIESFAEALSLASKLDYLKVQITEQEHKGLVEAAAEFRHAFSGRLQMLRYYAGIIASMDYSEGGAIDKAALCRSATSISNQIDRLAASAKRMSSWGDTPQPRLEAITIREVFDQCFNEIGQVREIGSVAYSSVECDGQVRADRQMLEESALCLLTNALDAIEDMRELKGEAGEWIKVSTNEDIEGVHITVSDGGVGFEASNSDRLFLPFYTTKTDRPVTVCSGLHQGIGLFTVKRVIRMHGGDVFATSPGPYLGASFTLRLPVQKEE